MALHLSDPKPRTAAQRQADKLMEAVGVVIGRNMRASNERLAALEAKVAALEAEQSR